MLIVDCIPDGQGWDPINHLVRMAADCLDAEVVRVKQDDLPSQLKRAASVLSQRSRGAGSETCLIIGKAPTDLLRIFNVPGWRTRFCWIGAWIIDSFWTDWIPTTNRFSQPFDDVFITSLEDADAWETALRARPTWLPWGSDVLALGSSGGNRPWDLTRVGRQPLEWEDDLSNQMAAEEVGIRFHPRPSFSTTSGQANHEELMLAYGETKFLLAFSNTVNPTNYTHPTREYLTGRWVDALGAGAVVAGIAPRGPGIDRLLWPGATLDLATTDRADGLATVGKALASWTAEVAHRNHAFALSRLDWRWRLRTIAEASGEKPARLAHQLQQLRERVSATSALTVA